MPGAVSELAGSQAAQHLECRPFSCREQQDCCDVMQALVVKHIPSMLADHGRQNCRKLLPFGFPFLIIPSCHSNQ